MATVDRQDPSEGSAQPEWLEAARQAFLWRYFYDDCGRSDPGKCGADRRGGSMGITRPARLSEAA